MPTYTNNLICESHFWHVAKNIRIGSCCAVVLGVNDTHHRWHTRHSLTCSINPMGPRAATLSQIEFTPVIFTSFGFEWPTRERITHVAQKSHIRRAFYFECGHFQLFLHTACIVECLFRANTLNFFFYIHFEYSR